MKPFPLTATLTRCRDGQALIVLESEPFNGLEIRPSDLQRLGERLTALAVMAGRYPRAASITAQRASSYRSLKARRLRLLPQIHF